jgi:hypothetical protein
MSELPAPLTPADCDLRGMPYMPLMGARLYSSDFNALASDIEFRIGLKLLWVAFEQQIPSGSLPSDDRILMSLAGISNRKLWDKIRPRALHGFIKCADGRLYNKFLSGLVIVAWDKRVAERKRKAEYRASKKRPKPTDNDTSTIAAEGQCPVGHDWDKSGTSDTKVTLTSASAFASASLTNSVSNSSIIENSKQKNKPPTPKQPGPVKPGGRKIVDDSDFEHFYLIYPIPTDKGIARIEYAKARKKVDAATIIAGLKSFNWPDDPQWVKKPHNWLKGECWANANTTRSMLSSNDREIARLEAELSGHPPSRPDDFFTGPTIDGETE